MGLGQGGCRGRARWEAQEGRHRGAGAGEALPPALSQGPGDQDSWLTSPSPEAVRQLPLFGYTVYVVLRVSQLPLPGPSFLGLNRQRLILMDPGSQVG